MLKLEGVIPPLVTPLTPEGGLDEPAARRLLRRVIDGGVDAVFVLGTTGEGPSLPEPVKRRLIGLACAEAAGRVPVLAGISSACLSDAASVARFAADAGADAAVLAPPFYFRIAEDELIAWCRAAAERCPLPIVLYHMPGNTAVHFSPAALEALIDDPRFVGFKDSGGDLAAMEAVLALAAQRRPGWPVICGPEDRCVAAVRAGAAGWTSAVAQLDPARTARLRDLLRQETSPSPETDEAGQAVVGLLRGLMDCSTGDGRIIRALKTALAHTGIGDGTTAPPLRPCRGRETHAVRQLLHDFHVPALLDGGPTPSPPQPLAPAQGHRP